MDKKQTLFQLVIASSLGTILEWYDFSLFAFLTPVLAKLFFPQKNTITALMLTYAIFAVGYFVRPLGAMLFGHCGDRLGRKKILIWSIVLMSLPTFFMGVIPTYSTLGITAPVLLILLRICQGLSAGGESTGAILFVLESVPVERRGFMGALIWSMVGIGMLMGSLAAMWVSHSDLCWAWRVPFLLGILTGLIGYFLRKRTLESVLFEKALQSGQLTRFPLKESLIKYKKEMGIIIGIYILSAMITYLIFIFMSAYVTGVIGLPQKQTTTINTLAFLLVTLLVPLAGFIADKIGIKKCLSWSALGFILFSYPLFQVISHGSLTQFVFAEFGFVVLAAMFQGVISAAVFELIPTSVRYSVIATGYNISYSLFGGTAPFVATYIVNFTGNKAAPGLYLVFGALIASIAIAKMGKRLYPISDVQNVLPLPLAGEGWGEGGFSSSFKTKE